MWESIIREVSTLLGVTGLAIDLVGAIVIITPDINRPKWLLRQSDTYQELVMERENMEAGRNLLYTDVDGQREDEVVVPSAGNDDGVLQQHEPGFDAVLDVLAAQANDVRPPNIGDEFVIFRWDDDEVYVKSGADQTWHIDSERFRAILDRSIDDKRRDARGPFLKAGVAILAVGFTLQILGDLLPIGFRMLSL